jgi:hypothetical protein
MQTNDFRPFPLIAYRPEDRPFLSRQAAYGYRTLNTWIVEPQINFRKYIGRGNFQALIGGTIQHNKSNANSLSSTGYNSDLVLEDIKSAASLSTNYSYASLYKYNAVYGRVNYNWAEKYVLNLTGRRDGSSRFGDKNQFHNFYSVGAAWIFSNEKWLNQNSAIISFGKIHGSYGTSGNDQLEDYKFMSLYNSVSNVQVPYQGITSLEPSGLPNPYLHWEETRKLQIGIDLGFLNDRVILDATYTRNRSSNQLIPYSYPSITGFQSAMRNFQALVQNTGWEFQLNTINVSSANIKWTSFFNITIPQNKLLDFPGLESSTYTNKLIVGQPLNIVRTYHFVDVDPVTGVYRFSNKTGGITARPSFPNDYTVLINTNPKFYGGFQNNITYKGFQLDFLFQFVKQIGRPILFNNTSAVPPGAFVFASSNQPASVVNRWSKTGDQAMIEKYTTDLFSSAADQLSFAIASDAGYEDASYIRLKNLSLSWQMPKPLLQKAHLYSCRLFAQGQNLLTITKYKGLDPETQGTSSLPPLRVFTLGLQFGF